MVKVLSQLDLGGQKATNAANPTTTGDLATYQWVATNFQPLDADLTAFAAIAASADGSFLGRSGGAYVMRSAANTKVDLSLDKVLNIKDNITATTNPGVSDDNTAGYSVGSHWFNITLHTAYFCASASTGAALWVKLNFISSVASPLVESGGGLTIPAAAGPSTDGYMLGADKAKLDALTMYNHLVNPGFEKKQRSASTFTVSGLITLDRWMMAIGGSSTMTISQITSTIGYPGFSAQMAYTHAAAGYGILYQIIEEYTQFIGKPVTFSATVKTATAGRIHMYLSDGVTAAYSSYNAGSGAERLSVTLTPGVGTTALVAAFLCDVATATVEVNDAVLVTGSYAAEFTPLHPEEDQTRCERYYQILLCTARFWAAAATNFMEVPLPYRVRMAGTPTGTLQADGTSVNQAATYPQVANVTDRGGRFLIGSAAAGDCYVIVKSLVLEYNPV